MVRFEGISISAAKRATHFEALEPIRQGVRQPFGAVSTGTAAGLQVRHDHGRQYRSDAFQAELRFLGLTSSPAFVRAPDGNSVAERFIRTLKERLVWVRTFQTVEELRQALPDWLWLYMNRGSLSGRDSGHQSRGIRTFRRRWSRHESTTESGKLEDHGLLTETRRTQVASSRRALIRTTGSWDAYGTHHVKKSRTVHNKKKRNSKQDNLLK
jgi:hypothetical protein